MNTRMLDSPNLRSTVAQSSLIFFSDSTPASGRTPRCLADQINCPSLCSSSSVDAASSPYLAFRQPLYETHNRPSDFNYRFPSLRMSWCSGRQWRPSSCARAQTLIQAHSNGNGYASAEAPKTDNRSLLTRPPPPFGNRSHSIEEFIERVIFDCRFLTLMAIVGSLAGSFLCFCKGCFFVIESFSEYIHASLSGFDSGQVILLLVEAVDVYLMGTVMLIFGMGLHELFVNSSSGYPERNIFTSNLFGMFQLRKRPFWLEIRSLDELKTKLGHVIVMILLVGMFEKSKKVPVNSGMDLLCFSASILMSSGCLFLLSKLNSK